MFEDGSLEGSRKGNGNLQKETEESNAAETRKDKIENQKKGVPDSASERFSETSSQTVSGFDVSSRNVWDNPILWREVCTKAYGKRAFLIRLSFFLLFGVTLWGVHQHLSQFDLTFYQENAAVFLFSMKVFIPLALLALVLVNAQAVTSITGERDGRAIDLLLVTDLSPKEIVFGKLGGIFWNTREIVLLPLLFLVYLCWQNVASVEITIYLFLGLIVLFFFAAVLGIHSGMTYAGSRSPDSLNQVLSGPS